jgi:hypothetical protein
MRAKMLLPSLLLLSLFCGTAAAQARDILLPDDEYLWAIGTAWTPDRSEVLYREFHYAERPELDLPTRVLYRNADGELMADKTIDYSRSEFAPAIAQFDYRNQAMVTTGHPEAPDARIIRVEYQAHDSERMRSRDVSHRDNLIVDAGFDPYVRENWDALTGGRSVTASFLVPARLDSVRISVSETDAAECNASGENFHCFIIRPAGVLRVVSWFVDPIRIAYDSETRRLLSFEGISNIRDDAGDTRNVLIDFEYF